MVKWTHFRKLGLTSIRPNIGQAKSLQRLGVTLEPKALSVLAVFPTFGQANKLGIAIYIYEIVRNDTVYFLLWKIRNYVGYQILLGFL